MHYSIIEGKWLALLIPHIQEVLGSNHLTVLMMFFMVFFSLSSQDTSHRTTITHFVYYSVILLQLETIQSKLLNLLIKSKNGSSSSIYRPSKSLYTEFQTFPSKNL